MKVSHRIGFLTCISLASSLATKADGGARESCFTAAISKTHDLLVSFSRTGILHELPDAQLDRIFDAVRAAVDLHIEVPEEGLLFHALRRLCAAETPSNWKTWPLAENAENALRKWRSRKIKLNKGEFRSFLVREDGDIEYFGDPKENKTFNGWQCGNLNCAEVNVAVIGGGPVGLVHGVLALLAGAKVTVFEQRRSYSRNTWFDVSDASVGIPARELLESLGLHEDDLQVRRHPGVSIISLRCQELERFLFKTLRILGGRVQRGWKASISDECAPGELLADRVSSVKGVESEKECVSFDLLVVADGTKSSVRQAIGVSYQRRKSLTIKVPPELQKNKELQSLRNVTLRSRFGSELWLDVEDKSSNIIVTSPTGLRQTTLIANFKTVKGECPTFRQENGKELDPYDPGFVFQDVTSVFKRFFFEYCEMQILLKRRASKLLITAIDKIKNSNLTENARYMWYRSVMNFLKDISNFLLVPEQCRDSPEFCSYPFADSVEELVERLRDMPSGGLRFASNKSEENLKLSEKMIRGVAVRVFDIEISAVPAVFGTLKLENQNRNRPYFIVGDASVTAHYRLGVGVNNGIASSMELFQIVKAMSEGNLNENESKRLEEESRFRVEGLVQSQLFSMLFEAYCGMITYKDQVYYHDDKTLKRDFVQFPSAVDALIECFRSQSEDTSQFKDWFPS